MIGRLQDALDQVRLLVNAPYRLSAVEEENAELLGRVIDLERQLGDLDAITREVYIGPLVERPVPDA